MKRVLLVGATGEFGNRLARHLARIPEIDLVLTSRSLARAQAAARDVAATTGCARVTGLAFDRAQGIAATLLAIRPWLVIDASGPFQGADFTTARAAIASGAALDRPCGRPRLHPLVSGGTRCAGPRQGRRGVHRRQFDARAVDCRRTRRDYRLATDRHDRYRDLSGGKDTRRPRRSRSRVELRRIPGHGLARRTLRYRHRLGITRTPATAALRRSVFVTGRNRRCRSSGSRVRRCVAHRFSRRTRIEVRTLGHVDACTLEAARMARRFAQIFPDPRKRALADAALRFERRRHGRRRSRPRRAWKSELRALVSAGRTRRRSACSRHGCPGTDAEAPLGS